MFEFFIRSAPRVRWESSPEVPRGRKPFCWGKKTSSDGFSVVVESVVVVVVEFRSAELRFRAEEHEKRIFMQFLPPTRSFPRGNKLSPIFCSFGIPHGKARNNCLTSVLDGLPEFYQSEGQILMRFCGVQT